MKVRLTVFNLVKELEKRERRSYQYNEIADETGISRNTVSLIMQGNTRMVRFETLEALLKFFRNRGMDVGLSDLMVVEMEGLGEIVPAEMVA